MIKFSSTLARYISCRELNDADSRFVHNGAHSRKSPFSRRNRFLAAHREADLKIKIKGACFCSVRVNDYSRRRCRRRSCPHRGDVYTYSKRACTSWCKRCLIKVKGWWSCTAARGQHLPFAPFVRARRALSRKTCTCVLAEEKKTEGKGEGENRRNGKIRRNRDDIRDKETTTTTSSRSRERRQ